MERKSPVQNPQVGRNVRKIRKAKKLSIRVFCGKVKPAIAANQLLSIELGKREPTIETVTRFAKALGVDPSELMVK